MKSLTTIIVIFASLFIYANPIFIPNNGFNNISNTILQEKKLTAIYDSFDGETYNFISIDPYGEEYFFLADEVTASVLEKFDLKSEALTNVSFEIHYTERPAASANGNTVIIITALIKI